MTQAVAPVRGALMTMAATFLFVCLDVLTKDLTTRVAIPFVIWSRFLVQSLVTIAVFRVQMGGGGWKSANVPLQILRGITMLATSALIVLALHVLPIPETTATVFASPLIASLIAVPLLGERVSAMGFAGVAAGFVGVLLIARPGSSLASSGIWFALSGAACYAFYQLLTRKLSVVDSPVTQLFYVSIIGVIGTIPAFPWFGDVGALTLRDWSEVLAMGLLGGCGHYFLIRAYRLANIAAVAPFIYTQLVWAALFGWLIFDHWPHPLSLAGIIIVAGSGLITALARR